MHFWIEAHSLTGQWSAMDGALSKGKSAVPTGPVSPIPSNASPIIKDWLSIKHYMCEI
jgi:hypothetical protein